MMLAIGIVFLLLSVVYCWRVLASYTATQTAKDATMTICLKCGAPATRETRDSDEPLCFAHGGGEPDVRDEAGEVTPRTAWLLLVSGFALLFLVLGLTQ